MHVSPSQITAYRQCQRRWYLRNVMGMPEPSTPAAEFGQRVHQAIEHLLGREVDGTDDEAARALADRMVDAAGAAGILPDTALTRVLVEHGVSWTPEELEGVASLKGRIDLLVPPTFWGDATVIDWKTRSSLKWAPSVESLKTDPQAVIYAWAVMQEMGCDKVLFAHVNGTTGKDTEVSVVDLVLDEMAICDGKLKVIRDVKDMAALATQPVEAAQADFTSCKAYGGCPHAAWCAKRADWPHKEVVMDRDTLSARLAARKINPPEEPVEAAQRRPAPLAVTTVPAARVEPVAAPAPTPAPTPDELVVPSSAKAKRVLLVGAIPLVGLDGAVWFDRWIAPMAEQVCQRHGIEHWGQSDYARAKSEIAGMVMQCMRRGELPRILIIDKNSKLGEEFAPMLMPAYDVVIGRLF